jgi:glycosyltransferase involved in cell wall biosynthesis
LFEGWFYRNATAITAISQRMCDHLVARGIPPKKITFIPTGVDMESGSKERANVNWWKRHGLLEGLRAVYLGAHGPANGLQFLLEAARDIGPDEGITLVLIGDGVDKPRLVAEAKKLHSGRIIFLPPVKRKDVPGILEAADVALMIDRVTPGAETSMPNKFFDYLAAGLPIVTNNPAELWDHVRDAKCGLLVDNHSPSRLVETLRQLRDDPRIRQEMGGRALALAQQRFDRRDLHERWELVLLGAARNGNC